MLATEREALPGAAEVTTQVLVAREVAAAVADYARDRADLVVVSTHGRTGLRRVLLGSVAESVLRAAETPVLVVPAGEPEGTEESR
jgi:nucleotide-binding universal stress UspA family protein